MSLGKSVRVYLKEGTVTGIKLAEVVNHTIQALSCPRNKISDLNKFFFKESNRPGVYFLIGDDGTNKTKVYIGEAENVWERLKTHDTRKDFWSDVILFTSKDENLTKSHVKYLECRLIEITTNADRYDMENYNTPSLSSLPLPDQDSMEDFILNIKLLNGTLGHNFLEDPVAIPTSTSNTHSENPQYNSTENTQLYLNIKDISAKALQTNEGVVVLKGSEASMKETKNYNYTVLREKLIAEGILIKEDNKFLFSKNYLFKNPSPAAAVIVGYSINGRNAWKDENGKSLNEIEKTNVLSN